MRCDRPDLCMKSVEKSIFWGYPIYSIRHNTYEHNALCDPINNGFSIRVRSMSPITQFETDKLSYLVTYSSHPLILAERLAAIISVQ